MRIQQQTKNKLIYRLNKIKNPQIKQVKNTTLTTNVQKGSLNQLSKSLKKEKSFQKRTKPQKRQHIRKNIVQVSEKAQVQSQNVKSKLPHFLERKTNLNTNLGLTKQNKKLKLVKMLSSIYNGAKIVCQICFQQFEDQKISSICSKKHYYCKACLNAYFNFKVKIKQLVTCPNSDCQEPISTQSLYYKSLSTQVKKKYQKTLSIYLVKNDPFMKLCIDDNCTGAMFIIIGEDIICPVCNKKYCPNCPLQKHQGSCFDTQVEFLLNKLNYTMCPSCMNAVQKIDGCPHIICRCKNQFCYVCGEKWNYGHGGVCKNVKKKPIIKEPKANTHKKASISRNELKNKNRVVENKSGSQSQQFQVLFNCLSSGNCICAQQCNCFLFPFKIVLRIISVLLMSIVLIIVYIGLAPCTLICRMSQGQRVCIKYVRFQFFNLFTY